MPDQPAAGVPAPPAAAANGLKPWPKGPLTVREFGQAMRLCDRYWEAHDPDDDAEPSEKYLLTVAQVAVMRRRSNPAGSVTLDALLAGRLGDITEDMGELTAMVKPTPFPSSSPPSVSASAD